MRLLKLCTHLKGFIEGHLKVNSGTLYLYIFYTSLNINYYNGPLNKLLVVILIYTMIQIYNLQLRACDYYKRK